MAELKIVVNGLMELELNQHFDAGFVDFLRVAMGGSVGKIERKAQEKLTFIW